MATTPVAPPSVLVPDRGRRTGGRRTLVLAAAAVVVLAGGGVVAGVAASGPDGTRTKMATADDDAGTARVAAWLKDNIASTAAIVSDDTDIVRGLGARGLAVTTTASLSAAVPGTYVVTAHAGTSVGTTPIALDATRALVPVARFGDTASTLDVGQVVGRAASEITQDRATESTTTRTAGTGLLANPAVTVAPAARPVLATGGLDLRSAAFLALLAGSQSIRVLQVPVDPAENGVGVLARRLVVQVDDRAGLQAAIDDAPSTYAPALSSAGTSGGLPADSLLLTWPLLADPNVIVS